MKYRILLALLAVGLCSDVIASEKTEYARVSLVGPGGSKEPVSRDQFIILVVEGPYISFDKTPIPEAGVIDFVNDLLKTKNVTYVGVHTREGVKYGDVVNAIDVLRKTNAKDIGVSLREIAANVNP